MTTGDLGKDVFEATYAVPMHCESCTNDIRNCLNVIPGVQDLSFDLKQQMLSVNGSAPPSSIIKALQKCGRDAIIRGTGKPNSSAVSILETFEKIDLKKDTPVRGLARIVEVGDKKTFFDITLNGVPYKGKYFASIHESGDISEGVASTGVVWHRFEEPIDCQEPSDLDPKLYSGHAFLKAPVSVWELIGRSFVVTADESNHTGSNSNGEYCGVIARSAGVWENDKQVCACSGKSIWQERKDALRNNIK